MNINCIERGRPRQESNDALQSHTIRDRVVRSGNEPIRTILLVDDHELVLRALHTYLEKRGYNVLEAPDGEEALLLAECFPGMIHVLVTDLVMVRMNGRELARRLMPLRPEMQVIMMSGVSDEIMAQQELSPQIPILVKPFLPKRLLIAIEEALINPQVERTVVNLVEPVRLPNRTANGSSRSLRASQGDN